MNATHIPNSKDVRTNLTTTCIGLGLVRLLQDARRFNEARATLYTLEGRIPPANPGRKQRKRTPFSRSARTGAA